MKISTRTLGQFALALVVASCGGALFALFGLPLPYILGSMSFCLLATLFKLPIATPEIVRAPVSSVIGVMLGAAFTPEVISSLAGWSVPLLGLAIYLLVAALACVGYYRKIAGYDAATAYFAGMPGGFMEMMLLGEAFGADARRIALAHSARILIVVFTFPFIVTLLSGEALNGSAAASHAPLTLESLGWLVGTALLGLVLGHLLKLPARALLGPMAVSAAIHISGLSSFTPPSDIVVIAQIVLGASIGCRFVGIAARELGQILALAAGATVILLALTLVFAHGVAALAPSTPVELMLAYSPGGLTEMGLMALSLNIEVAFVAGHHIARVILVSLGAAAVARLALSRRGRARTKK